MSVPDERGYRKPGLNDCITTSGNAINQELLTNFISRKLALRRRGENVAVIFSKTMLLNPNQSFGVHACNVCAPIAVERDVTRSIGQIDRL